MITTDEALDLPRRELDAMVAGAMGWTEIQHGPGCDCCVDTWEEWTGLPPLKDGDDGTRFPLHPSCGQCGQRPMLAMAEIRVSTKSRITIPAFTNRYAIDIWGLVEWIRSTELYPGCYPDISIRQMDRLEGGKWVVETNGPPTPTSGSNFSAVYVKHEDLPVAIVLAFLKARGVIG